MSSATTGQVVDTGPRLPLVALPQARDGGVVARPARPPAYAEQAPDYDVNTAAFQVFREQIVGLLDLRPGDVVLDVGCGTGLCFPLLLEKVGPTGRVVGIDESPEMLELAQQRVDRAGWANVGLLPASAVDTALALQADAALFCAVHDVLRDPHALHTVLRHLRPGAQVAAGGGKWAPPWMVALNCHVLALHAPYVRSFEGFAEPWSHLRRLLDDFRVTEVALGAGYLASGRVPRRVARKVRW